MNNKTRIKLLEAKVDALESLIEKLTGYTISANAGGQWQIEQAVRPTSYIPNPAKHGSGFKDLDIRTLSDVEETDRFDMREGLDDRIGNCGIKRILLPNGQFYKCDGCDCA